MNARNYRANLHLSPLDFPPTNGLGQHTDSTLTDVPFIADSKVVLKITKGFILIDLSTNEEHEVFNAQSVYEIPVGEIKTREDIYECYKDATLTLSEAYQHVRTQLPTLPDLSFPTQPIETFEREIGGVFHLLSSRN